jgi:phosphatidylserine decarboxylase
MMREQQPLLKKLKLLLLFNPLMDWVDTTHAVRLWTHDRSLRTGMQSTQPT